MKHLSIYPELGQTVPESVQIEYSVSYGGKLYLTTDFDLKGRGITKIGDGSDHKRNKKTYLATETAFKKLKEKFICCYIEKL